MPNISFYANETDVLEVVDWLNDEIDLAFIVANGEQAWKAVSSVEPQSIFNVYLFLWHVPSGPLPLFGDKVGTPPTPISDPWLGWIEQKQSPDQGQPWFGSAYPGVFSLRIQPTSRFLDQPDRTPRKPAPPGMRVIGRSDFGWVGKTYKPLPTTVSMWRKLERFIYKRTIPVDASGWTRPGRDPTPPAVANDKSYVAFAGALAEMRNGTPWAAYPDYP